MDKKLLDIIACPLCKGKFKYDKKNHELICTFDRLAFPIRDEIPIMIDSEARLMPLEETEKWQTKASQS